VRLGSESLGSAALTAARASRKLARMRCAVCGGSVDGEPRYGNAWEKSLAIRACCGAECVAAFDVDVHWIPSDAPEPVSDDDSLRLVTGARQRLRDGESPSLVARDLLIAGVAPWVVRRMLDAAGIAAAASRATAGQLSLMTLLGGIGWVSRDRRDPRATVGAHADVDAWEQTFAK